MDVPRNAEAKPQRRWQWWMTALCLVPLAAILAVTVFGVPLSSLLLYGMVLLCPLMHVFMMRGHGHGGGHGGHADGQASCHAEQDTAAAAAPDRDRQRLRESSLAGKE